VVTALNYDSLATTADVSACELPRRGCHDSRARNYMPLANVAEPGSCILSGCTDSTAPNYWSAATHDDRSCRAWRRGCTNPAADNFFSLAELDDGSCVLLGCTNPHASNYWPTATFDDGTCKFSGSSLPPASPQPPLPQPDAIGDTWAAGGQTAAVLLILLGLSLAHLAHRCRRDGSLLQGGRQQRAAPCRAAPYRSEPPSPPRGVEPLV